MGCGSIYIIMLSPFQILDPSIPGKHPFSRKSLSSHLEDTVAGIAGGGVTYNNFTSSGQACHLHYIT